jgi:eukaryotic-like serine/threonine-protein kinase
VCAETKRRERAILALVSNAEGDVGLAATYDAQAAPDLHRTGAPDVLIGRRLKHFEVLSLLGRGGMGTVYLANDMALERPVALKVLAPKIAHDPSIIARFVREARAQARLRHPNVAQIYFISEEQGLHFLVMEYLHGPTLEQVLEREECIPWRRAMDLIAAAARGLRAAADEGFIHRDVKPSNLMIDRQAGIKLLDFGLVHDQLGDSRRGSDGTIVGSPFYISPEQATGAAVDERSDIYSLGCTLYHMLSGQPPFNGDTPVAVLAKHVTETPAPLARIAPDVPRSLQRIVERMMAKAPHARFATYDDLLAGIDAARDGGAAPRRTLGRRAWALVVDAALLAPAALLLGPWTALLVVAYFVACGRLAGRTLGDWVASRWPPVTS